MAEIDHILNGKPFWTFTVHGEPKDRSGLLWDFIRVLDNTIGRQDPRISHDLRYNYINVINDKVRSDYSNYYLKSGAKITKGLKTVLSRSCKIPKPLLEKHWAEICKGISELYMPTMKVDASFSVPMSYIGEGVIESGQTCISSDGENAICGTFLRKFRRTRILFLRNSENIRSRARCIAFFPGNRKVILTNFYTRNFPQNRTLFVKAVKEGISVNGSGWSVGEVGRRGVRLPIYLNGDAISLITGTPARKHREIKYPCPHCNRKFLWHKRVEEDSGPINFGCSTACVNGYSTYQGRCEDCGRGLSGGADEYFFDNNVFCEQCYDRIEGEIRYFPEEL